MDIKWGGTAKISLKAPTYWTKPQLISTAAAIVTITISVVIMNICIPSRLLFFLSFFFFFFFFLSSCSSSSYYPSFRCCFFLLLFLHFLLLCPLLLYSHSLYVSPFLFFVSYSSVFCSSTSDCHYVCLSVCFYSSYVYMLFPLIVCILINCF